MLSNAKGVVNQILCLGPHVNEDGPREICKSPSSIRAWLLVQHMSVIYHFGQVATPVRLDPLVVVSLTDDDLSPGGHLPANIVHVYAVSGGRRARAGAPGGLSLSQ